MCATSSPPIPMGTQKMLFSATLDGQVEEIVDSFLVDPVSHETTPVTAAVTTMDHHVLAIAPVGQAVRHRPARGPQGPHPHVHPHPARRRARRSGADRGRCPRRGAARQQAAGPAHQRAGRLPPGRLPRCSSRPTSPHEVSTSTTSPWWSTSTRPTTSRSTCTARAAPPAPGPPVVVVTLALPHQIARPARILAGAGGRGPAGPRTSPLLRIPALDELGGRGPAGTPAEDPATVKYKGAPRKLDLSSVPAAPMGVGGGATGQRGAACLLGGGARRSWPARRAGPCALRGRTDRWRPRSRSRGEAEPSGRRPLGPRRRRRGPPLGRRRGPGTLREHRKGQGRGRSGAPSRAPRRRGGR